MEVFTNEQSTKSNQYESNPFHHRSCDYAPVPLSPDLPAAGDSHRYGDYRNLHRNPVSLDNRRPGVVQPFIHLYGWRIPFCTDEPGAPDRLWQSGRDTDAVHHDCHERAGLQQADGVHRSFLPYIKD